MLYIIFFLNVFVNEFFPGGPWSFEEVIKRKTVRICMRMIVLGKNIILIIIRKNKGGLPRAHPSRTGLNAKKLSDKRWAGYGSENSSNVPCFLYDEQRAETTFYTML